MKYWFSFFYFVIPRSEKIAQGLFLFLLSFSIRPLIKVRVKVVRFEGRAWTSKGEWGRATGLGRGLRTSRRSSGLCFEGMCCCDSEAAELNLETEFKCTWVECVWWASGSQKGDLKMLKARRQKIEWIDNWSKSKSDNEVKRESVRKVEYIWTWFTSACCDPPLASLHKAQAYVSHKISIKKSINAKRTHTPYLC